MRWDPQLRKGKSFVFIGDQQSEVAPATKLLVDRIRPQRGQVLRLDMEPLEVISAMIRDSEYDSIGGHPQVVKIYQHLATVPFVVQWADDRSLLGRPLLPYEAPDRFPRIFLNYKGGFEGYQNDPASDQPVRYFPPLPDDALFGDL